MTPEENDKLLELCNPEGKVVLDVGCGDGRYSELFSKYAKQYIGIDLDEKQIEANRKNINKDNVSFVVDNIIKYNPKERFDIIFLSLALHEIDIKEQGLAMQNMLNLLSEDGIIIIFDPALKKDSFQGVWNAAYDSIIYYDHDYSVKHSHDVIKKAVDDSLCEIIKTDYFEIPFEFKSIDEMVEMIISCEDFKYIEWNEERRNLLYSRIKDIVKVENNIVVYDKLDVTVIKRR